MSKPASKSLAGPIIGAVLVSALAYVIFREHVAGLAPWSDLSLYTLNKGIALGAFVLLTCGFSFKPLFNLGIQLPGRWLNARKALCMTGFLLMLIHSLLAILLFKPAVYGILFKPDGTLTLPAGLSMLCGAIAFVLLSAYNLSFQTFLREDRRFNRLITSPNFMQVALLLGAAHLFMLGYPDWLNPGNWQARLPPVSLLAFLVFILGTTVNLLDRS